MFGSYLIELVIGLSFLFAVLGLVTTAVTESALAVTSVRARHLQEWLWLWTRNVLGRHATVAGQAVDLGELASHPLLDQGRGDNKLPSYLPPQRVAAALLQSLAMPFGQTCVGRDLQTAEASLRAHILTLQNPSLEKALGALLDTAVVKAEDGTQLVDTLTTELGTWIDEAMQRIEGWTKRHAKVISLIVGAVICLGFNVSVYEVLNVLSSDNQARTALASAGATFVAKECAQLAPPGPDAAASAPSQEAINARLNCLREGAQDAVASLGPLSKLGIGWDRAPRFVTAWQTGAALYGAGQFLLWLLGVAAAAYAASLGGDFWFKWLADIIRLTGYKPPAATPATGTAAAGK
jgi:hypothetical protein